MSRLRWWEIRRRRGVAELVEDAQRAVVYLDQAVIDHAVELVVHDLSTTLGWDLERAGALARAAAEN